VAGLATTFGSGAMTNSSKEFRNAGCILAIGTNTPAAHPVIWLDMKKGIKNGAKLIVANPRSTALTKYADIWLRHKPGSDVVLLMGLALIIMDAGLYDKQFIDSRTENFEALWESLKTYDIDFVEKTTGVPRAQLIAAAKMYASQKPSSIVYAMGITQHTHGTDNVVAIANLAMLTGNIGKPSTGVNPLRGQNNVQGACDMGALPNVYSGYQSVTDPANKAKFEAAWGKPMSLTAGKTLPDILQAANDHKIKAIYLIGENPALSDPDLHHIEHALEQTEFLVVQDIFLTETAKYAHVVLPAATFAEKDGTNTNTERRVQLVRKVFEPVGESKPDWWITCQIAKRMGATGFDFTSSSQIMDEVARVTPSYGGISCARLEKGSLQWPCPTPEHPGTPILHTVTFSRGKGKFFPLTYRPPAEVADNDYPLILTTERSLYHYHTGTMTRKAAGLNILRPSEVVEINPKDAAALGIAEGEVVRVTSRRGELTVKAKVTEASPIGVISMSFHFAETPTNVLTNPAMDPVSKMPELKVAAVRVTKITKTEGELVGVNK
jgi:formate dehydrogenase alpha subunit